MSSKVIWMFVGTLIITSAVFAEVPRLINYQGTITGPDGPLDGTYVLLFRIYPDSLESASILWEELHGNVNINYGLFCVILGSKVSIPDTLFNGNERWLGVRVGADPEITPRMRITSVPWAFHAVVADTALMVVDVPQHEHDDRYYTKTDLNVSDGSPPNVGSNRVSWHNLLDVPAGFADGVDSIGSAGDTAQYAWNADKLDGQHASNFLGISDKAADSDLLDGYNYDNLPYVDLSSYQVVAGIKQFSSQVQFLNSSGYPIVVETSDFYGIDASNHSSTDATINAENSNSSGTGIVGAGEGENGWYLTNGSGGAFTGFETGLYAYAAQTGNNGQEAIYAKLGTGEEARLCYRSSTGTHYKVQGDGIASSIMSTSKGRVSLVCPESPEAWVEDFGRAELKNGLCHVELDPIYLECISVNDDHPLNVFIQLTSPLENQFYVKKGKTGFDVIALGKNSEIANATFDYRVVGKWVKYENVRFEPVDEETRVETQTRE